jgi:hypothetical protein
MATWAFTVTTALAQGNCMQDNYLRDPKNSGTLGCNAKEVFLVELRALASATCVQGGNITLSLNGTVNFNSDRYDPGWYIATDGGNALVGQCFTKVLLQNESGTTIVDANGNSAGSVQWNNDAKKPNDACGDVFVTGGGDGLLNQTNIARDLSVKW